MSLRVRLFMTLALSLIGVLAADLDNTVLVEDAGKHWCVLVLFITVLVKIPHISTTFCSMIMPRTPHKNIGDSEHPGGMQSYCSSSAHTSDSQGLLPDNFWRNVEFKAGNGSNGGKWAQREYFLSPRSVSPCISLRFQLLAASAQKQLIG